MPNPKLLKLGRATLRKLHREAVRELMAAHQRTVNRATAILLDETSDPGDAVEVMIAGNAEALALYQTTVTQSARAWEETAREQDRVSRMARLRGRRHVQ